MHYFLAENNGVVLNLPEKIGVQSLLSLTKTTFLIYFIADRFDDPGLV